jgi:hypothetical protein
MKVKNKNELSSFKENTFAQLKSKAVIIFIISLLAVLVGCSTNERKLPELREVVFAKEAPVPEGVVRQCWEEPLVVTEQNGPGLDAEGQWYHPSYTAVREVRQGRWRPCAPVNGDTIERN